MSLASISVFTLTAIAIIMTWAFNHTEGSLLIMMLLHASVNVSMEVTSGLFSGLPTSNLNGLIGFGVTALLIVLLTRGRLGHQPE